MILFISGFITGAVAIPFCLAWSMRKRLPAIIAEARRQMDEED